LDLEEAERTQIFSVQDITYTQKIERFVILSITNKKEIKVQLFDLII